MAQFAPFSTLQAQQSSAQFASAFAYVAAILKPGTPEHTRLKAMAPGSQRIELGGGLYAMEQVYNTKARPDCFFEAHRKYIDVQVMVEGEEAMEVTDIARLKPTMDYSAERDVIKYADVAGASRLVMRAGDAALFFPIDGHMPSIQLDGKAVLVRKTVVKVPVA